MDKVQVNTPGPCISLFLSDLQITSQVVSGIGQKSQRGHISCQLQNLSEFLGGKTSCF